MELNEIPKHPSAEGLGMSLEEYETVILFKCCGTEFNEALITDDNGYDGDFCLKCGSEDSQMVRRVV